MFSIYVVVLSLVIEIGITNPIYNGSDVGKVTENGDKYEITGQNEFPFMAYITMYYKRIINGKELDVIGNCGGVILSENAILTAAHCVSEVLPNPKILVRVGIVDIHYEIGQSVWVSKYAIHERFIKEEKLTENLVINWRSDIAILWLSENLMLNEYNVKKADLLTSTNLNNFISGYILGWGKNESGHLPSMLQKVKMTIVPFDRCTDAYKKNFFEPNSLCLQGHKCCLAEGDSGGPFVVQGKVYGIASFSLEFEKNNQSYHDPKIPQLYTHIGYYITWIKEKLKNGPKPKQPADSVRLKRKNSEELKLENNAKRDKKA